LIERLEARAVDTASTEELLRLARVFAFFGRLCELTFGDGTYAV
jgi:hypothetical protein